MSPQERSPRGIDRLSQFKIEVDEALNGMHKSSEPIKSKKKCHMRGEILSFQIVWILSRHYNAIKFTLDNLSLIAESMIKYFLSGQIDILRDFSLFYVEINYIMCHKELFQAI